MVSASEFDLSNYEGLVITPSFLDLKIVNF